MVTKNEIVEIVFNSIEELNQQIDVQISKELNTKLLGKDGGLDSIDLVNLITIIEEKVEDLTGNYIPIADERALSLEKSPFKTVESLVNYLEVLVNE